METIEQLKEELRITNALLDERNKILAAIPSCPLHGECVPHALEWIELAKRIIELSNNNVEKNNDRKIPIVPKEDRTAILFG